MQRYGYNSVTSLRPFHDPSVWRGPKLPEAIAVLGFWFTVLYRAIFASLTTIGQTWFGLLYAAITLIVSVGLVGHAHGLSAMKEHAAKVAVEVVVVAFLSWLPFFAWHLADMPLIIQAEAVSAARKVEREKADQKL